MSLIKNVKQFPSRQQATGHVFLMCGFGGAIWQTKRLTLRLNRAGYDVTALDFSKQVLSSGDPSLLPQLVDEVVRLTEKEAKNVHGKTLLVGISLGSLLALNIFRRSKQFDTGILITGGNIVDVAQGLFGDAIWPHTHAQLSDLWKDVNIHTDPRLLVGKRMLFVLPSRDRLIDTSEVIDEIARQNLAGNEIQLVKRGLFGHVGTIIEETIFFPGRVIQYIERII